MVPSALTRYRDALDAEMREIVGSDGSLLYRMMRYHLGWEELDGRPGPGAGGKALRPALCLLACEGTTPPLPPPQAEGGGTEAHTSRRRSAERMLSPSDADGAAAWD